ncbi:SUMF1/EgtB/PvdO family nonheme iron enzyme [Nannocystis sp. RBIL2]|uniref:formylglycine-generating enzyme family protein n=1 Tax=Nannocystis sp. RBIL2 TaxID=2996788 RepID=UPI00226F9C5E|nr:SUMF1/EgtB/PvdO family nonheme iron enzyme [Nannocystis sp. RBIL2]
MQGPNTGSTSEQKSGPTGQAGPAETRLALDVPPGLAVTVDGEPRGKTSQEPLVVAPGKHTLELDGPCGKASATVEAAVGALTTVSAPQFAGLQVAQLTVTAKTPEGKPANPAVFLGDWEVPGAAAQPTAIPACQLRLRLVADGLEGFMEDIEFEAGKSYQRELVLASGPDMVRIAGGHFRLGPPGPDHYDPTFNYQEAYEDFEGWPYIKTYEVDVATFDIDRAEVTAEEFHACYKAGFCADEPVLSAGTKSPPPELRKECSINNYTPMRDPRPGREKHPATCVAGWEAKKYCEWVGKRLPTDAEWEFAARSRKSEYACSWGGGYSPKVKCDRSGPNPWMREVCSSPKDDTEQGLCDMTDSVGEMMTHALVPGRPAPSDCRFNTVGRGEWPFSGGDSCTDKHQSPYRGFRCARDVSAAPAQG